MRLNISRDYFNNPIPPRVFLCNTGKKIIQELQAYDRVGNFKWNSYSELQFSVDRTYVDLIDGETKVHPTYDKIESPRNVLLSDYGYFALQDIDDTSGEKDVKSVSAFSLEYATSNSYLTNWHINTGEVDSKEVLYNEEQYGVDYNTDIDSFYEFASGNFDPYESYYQITYTDTDSYIYEQVQIADEGEYAERIDAERPDEKIYVKKFPNVQFYNNNPSKRGLSLLHLVFENIPGWQIGNVDQSLWRKERKFSEDRISVYDFLMSSVAETFGCVVVWDSLTGRVNFYEELEDDSDVDNEVNTRFETDVFISKDNLASECKVSYSSDNIKTKLVVTGSDNLDIREINLGSNSIMDLSFYHTPEWMEQDLFDAYEHYLEELKEAETGLDRFGMASETYPMAYSDAVKGWVSANNRWNDLMNAVPAEGNVVLVGDQFEKLYCSYSPLNSAYCNITINEGTVSVETNTLFLDEGFTKPIPTPSDKDMYVVQGALLIYDYDNSRFNVDFDYNTRKTALIRQLNLYHVDDDTEADKQDNILLKLKNSNSDVATIRIYDRRKIATEYEEEVSYYVKNEDESWREEKEPITNGTEFNSAKATYEDRLYTNDFYIQSVVVSASTGTSEDPDEYPILRWIKGELTSEVMDLEDYKVTYIGTMGAYFVLAKDETDPANLQDYGVRLLEEKHKTYTTIFQTQTEAMFSQEKAQCIVKDEEPEGDYSTGTRWLDTNSSPVVLKQYNGTSWETISAEVSETDRRDYENYQRYIDNYNKLEAVQEVLSEKERNAEYCKYGYEVNGRVINLRDGSRLEENMRRAATEHFNGYAVTRKSMNSLLPLYTFTTSFDPITYSENAEDFNEHTQYYVYELIEEPDLYVYTPVDISDEDDFDEYETLYVQTGGHEFAVYLQGETPYVSYANSQGVYQMIMEYIRDKTDMSNPEFFTADQRIRLAPFIKEDEFNDSNFFLTGYESEEDRLNICEELMQSAIKELNTLCKPSLEFSMTMANIHALNEFEPLFDQFQLGNFIRVGIRDGYVKRSRLLEVNMNFDDLSDFSCTFGNLVTTKSEVDRHADLLSQAVSAGRQVAKSSGSWQKSVDKTNWIEDNLSNGLRDLTLEVGAASGQAISWDSTGMHFRKYRDGSTTEYEPEEMAIINNALVATNDSWRTSKAAFGKYKIGNEERWGPIAEYVTADTLEGKLIRGGAIEIGSGDTKFIVNEDGSVEIRSGGTNYINAMQEIDNAYRFSVVLSYSGLTIFSDVGHTCTVTCKVFDYQTEITNDIIGQEGTEFKWTRASNDTRGDSEWEPTFVEDQPNVILIDVEDVVKNSQFYCEVEFNEELLTSATPEE